MQKQSKLEYPPHLRYTQIEQLKTIVPGSFSLQQLSVKELLDNSADAAEKNGGFVKIVFKDNRFRISNSGAITKNDIKTITTFDSNITEKYMKRAYIRGQIGHGLKIAIMLAISENHHIYVTSDGYHHVIKLISRYAKKPGGVLEVISEKNRNTQTTTFDIPLSDGDSQKIKQYVRNFIALNPHIGFELNSEFFKPRSSVRKSDKVDIFSYDLEDFEGFTKSYFTQDFPTEDFVKMFNIKKGKFKNILDSYKKGTESLYNSLRSNSKKIPVPFFGEEAIAMRVKDVTGKRVLVYEKIVLEKKESLEIAFLEGNDSDPIPGVNGTCLDNETCLMIKGKNLEYLGSVIYYLNIRKPMFLSYHSTTPLYQDSNKKMAIIPNTRAYNAIKRLYKDHFPDNIPSKEWLISKTSYKHLVGQEPSLREEARKIGVNPVTYCFLSDCKKIALLMHMKYGHITLRQLYYQLVSKQIVRNFPNSYDNFIQHMTTAREAGFIDYDIFEDRSRYTLFPKTVSLSAEPELYIKAEIKKVMEEPEINIWENQPYYVELWIEKDALVGLFRQPVNEKQVPLFPARGYASITKIKEAEKRFMKKVRNGKKVVILYAGDLDPSGSDIYKDICSKLDKVENIKVERYALNMNQVKNLSPMPIKKTDSRYQKFLEEHPEIKGAYELDAMDPEELRSLTRTMIEKYFDHRLVPHKHIARWYGEFKEKSFSIFQKIWLH